MDSSRSARFVMFARSMGLIYEPFSATMRNTPE
jgi:hypothetical protein